MTTLPLPQALPASHPKFTRLTLQIAAPCSADWNAMPGDTRVRHCGECKKNVYNLSALTEGEALALIRAKEGRLCVRYYERADGTVLTQDCPVGVRAKLQAKLRATWAGVAALAVLGLGLLGIGCASRSTSGTSAIGLDPVGPPPPVGRVMMGAPPPMPYPPPVQKLTPATSPSPLPMPVPAPAAGISSGHSPLNLIPAEN